MRLLDLRLSQFGVFDQLELGFRPGAVHLVYGPNEAGKSTCHAALLGHFFGWNKSKGVAAVQGQLARVGARWQARGGDSVVDVTRLAGGKLVDERGQELREGSYEARFAPFGRAEFETFFALDHPALRDGATLLGDKGSGLRDALFAAARSGDDVRRVHAALVEEEEKLFKPRGRTLAVHNAIKKMKDRAASARDLSSPSEKWEQESRALRDAEAARDALAAESAALRQERDRLGQLDKLAPCVAKLGELDAALAALPPAVEITGEPSVLADRLRGLEAIIATQGPRAHEAEARVAVLSEQLQEARRDAEFAAHEAAAKEARDAASELARLQRLPQPSGPATEEPPGEEALRPVERALGDLARARDHLARLRTQRRDHEDELARVPEPTPPTPSAAALRTQEREARAAEVILQRLADERAAHEKALTELEGRAGFADAHVVLAGLGLPTRDEARERVVRLREREAEAAHAEREATRLAAEHAELARAVEQLVKTARVPNEAELERARLARDELVVTKPNLLALSAAIREADAIVDALRHAADRVAERAAKEDELARTELRAAQLRAEATQRRRLADAEAAELATRLAKLPGPARSALELESWAALAERAQQLVADARAQERVVTPPRVDPTELAVRAERAEAEERAVERSATRRTELGAALAKTLTEITRAEDDERAALAALPARDPSELEGWIRRSRDERAAWERTRAEHDEHQRAARAIAERRSLLDARLPQLGLAPDGMPPEALAAALDDRLHTALKAEERAAALERDLGQAKLDARVARGEHDAARTERASIPHGLPVLALEAERRELAAARIAELALAARVVAPNALAPLLEAARERDPEATQRALHEARARALEVETALEAARRDAAQKEVGVRAMGQADHTAALALFEAEGARAEAVALASRWAVASLGRRLINRALERYRAEHQDPVLAQASRAFAALTGGRYVRVVPEIGDGKEKLRLAAEHVDGTRRLAAELSEGTRDQLYLALRFGTLQARAEDGRLPLPIVLDDVFVNFDDGRTTAGLACLAELVQLTDVIYFTHHEHVLELAASALPPDLLDVVRLDGLVAPNDAALAALAR